MEDRHADRSAPHPVMIAWARFLRIAYLPKHIGTVPSQPDTATVRRVTIWAFISSLVEATRFVVAHHPRKQTQRANPPDR